MKQFLVLIIGLVLLSSIAFAAPSLTINQPSSTSIWWGTRTIDFNAIDENASVHIVPPSVKLYYSTTEGGYKDLIIDDVNLDDGVGVVCADYNFVNSTNCTYSWAIPTSLTNGYYYIDGNFLPRIGSAGYTDSSVRFEISQKLTTNSCGLVNLFPLLVIAVMIVAIIMGAMAFINGGSLTGLTVATIASLIVIVIMMLMPAFMSALCG